MNYRIFLDGIWVGFIVGLHVAYLLNRFGGRPKAKTKRRDIDKLVDQFEKHYRDVRGRDANLSDE